MHCNCDKWRKIKRQKPMYLCGIPYCELGDQKKLETKRHRNRSLKLI
jgi:hypothetical protein